MCATSSRIRIRRLSRIALTSKNRGVDSELRQERVWDGSIQARPHPKEAGAFENAFAHHRVEAAKRAKVDPIGVVVANGSNADRLKMMAHENDEEFRSDALVSSETIAAVIDAFGRGEIELEAIAKDTNKSAIFEALPSGNAYTLATVARFIGWAKPSNRQAISTCRRAFDAYHHLPIVVLRHDEQHAEADLRHLVKAHPWEYNPNTRTHAPRLTEAPRILHERDLKVRSRSPFVLSQHRRSSRSAVAHL